MKESKITYKLFKEVGLIILFFSALIILTNTILLKPIYYYLMKENLIEAMEQLTEIDYGAQEGIWLEEVVNVDSGAGFSVTIFDSEGLLYSSSSEIGIQKELDQTDANETRDYNNNFKERTGEIEEWKNVRDNIYLSSMIDERSQTEIILCKAEIEGHVKIITSQPLEPVNDSITVANNLYIIVTLIMLMITILIVLKFSNRFTKPIYALREQVASIANLDFGTKSIILSGDELEDLSRDVVGLSSRLEEALTTLAVQNKQLEYDVESQKKFLSNVSHELRTPLSVILGYAEEMKAGYIKDPQQQKVIMDYIAEESIKMSRLLNEILDLSRLESGRMNFEYFEMNIADTVGNFLEKYQGFISNHGLTVENNIGSSVVGKIDIIRFEQILANYISNAAKYCNAAKQVKIFSESVVYEKDEKEVIRISVYNSGEHISEDILMMIWDFFYKADASRADYQDGFGLGLSIVKAIQNIAGFKYGVYNHENGVVFWFDIEKVQEVLF